MKNTTFSTPLVLALFALIAVFAAPTAHAVIGRPSAITFVDSNQDRHIYAFARGNNYHLVSNHFNGTTWTWTDHGVPEGVGISSINNPRAVTYIDDSGKRRIYVFVVDDFGQLWVLFHKGAGFNWQWAHQGGPAIKKGSLSATTFLDDNGVRRIYAFGIKDKSDGEQSFPPVANFWNGSSWSWHELNTLTYHPYTYSTFTEVTNYIDNDGRRRMDMFCDDGYAQDLARHSWVDGAWSLTNLNGQAVWRASVVNFQDSSGYRHVHTFVNNPSYWTIWDSHDGFWSEVGIPSQALQAYGISHGFMSATAYRDGGGFARMDLFAEFDHRLYMRAWVNQTWQPWVNLGRPRSPDDDGVENTVAITYAESRGGDQQTWVFMTGLSGRLHAKFWNGTVWQWLDLGNP